ncbi:alpha/beta hydrolase [Photobacterium ganghwense]|uniref:alpha/beta hydrolase n=1 Tax=Photobacterium ganghwense TaxID=320778 RepID=UPI0039EEB1F4
MLDMLITPRQTTAKTNTSTDVAMFNNLVTLEGRPTNMAIWCPLSELANPPERQQSARYYLSHMGSAVKTRCVEAKPDVEIKKFCLMLPGFNGGPFDCFHLAEKLAQQGYWVLSVGCYINPNLKPSEDPDKVAFALADAYPEYNAMLRAFSLLTGVALSDERINRIRYVSFSAGIYPLIRAVCAGNCPNWQHDLMLMAPGLSATRGLSGTLRNAPITDIQLVHSEQDRHPTYGSPLAYLNMFDRNKTTLHLLQEGEHYDFIHLPRKTRHTEAQSQHEQTVKSECLAVLDALLQGEKP